MTQNMTILYLPSKVSSSSSSLLPDGLDGLEHVEGLADVSVLCLKELGQPAPLVGEPHVQHCLEVEGSRLFICSEF